jgi:hypothetical protein
MIGLLFPLRLKVRVVVSVVAAFREVGRQLLPGLAERWHGETTNQRELVLAQCLHCDA